MTVQADNGRVVVLSERLAEATHTGDAKWLREAEDVFVWKGGTRAPSRSEVAITTASLPTS